MKLLTINTHSLIEEEYEKKLEIFVEAVYEMKPDIIAMQEVNQTVDSEIFKGNESIYVSGNIPLKADNHAANVWLKLREKGLLYNFAWHGIKLGYGRYDEGLAVFSIKPIEKTHSIKLSQIDDYENWKTRKALGIMVNGEWFYSVHMGWWNDGEEPFYEQWSRFNEHINKKEKIWLMGDFNSPDRIKDEGYECVLSYGWYDTHVLAENKDEGFTVSGKIDGWKSIEKSRIDYIFTNVKIPILSSCVVFNGKNREQISDHFGVTVTI